MPLVPPVRAVHHTKHFTSYWQVPGVTHAIDACVVRLPLSLAGYTMHLFYALPQVA